MAVCVLLTSLTKEGKEHLQDYPGQIKEYNRVFEALGMRVVGQYVLVGQYDLLEIIEGENREALYKAALDLADKRISQTVVLQGMSLEEVLEPEKK